MHRRSLKKTLEPRLEEAKAGRRCVFFMDAAHFVFAPFLGYLWCFTRLFIKAPAGRKRFNVLGALDAISHEMITVTNTGYINAESVCEMFAKIAIKCCNIPVSIVLDNARYQKCKLVQELAESLKIELLYLPPYSPNLNVIERYWKFFKKIVLNNRYYETFEEFKQACKSFFRKRKKYLPELETLLTEKFHISAA